MELARGLEEQESDYKVYLDMDGVVANFDKRFDASNIDLLGLWNWKTFLFKIIFFLLLWIAPNFSSSKIFLLAVSLDNLSSFDICIMLILSKLNLGLI